MDTAIKYNVNIPYIEATYLYALYLTSNKDYTNAIQYSTLCNLKSLEVNKKQYIIKSSSLLYRCYNALQATPSSADSAIKYLKLKEVYLDSIINYYKSEQVEIITTEMNLKELKKEEEKLKEESELRIIAIWTLIIGLVCIIIFVLAYKQRKTYDIGNEKKITRLIFFIIFVTFELIIIWTHSMLEYKSIHPILSGLLIIVIAIGFEQLNHRVKIVYTKFADKQREFKLNELMANKAKIESLIQNLQNQEK